MLGRGTIPVGRRRTNQRPATDQGVDPCEDGELLIRRVLALSGANRQFINGCQTTLGSLKEVGDGLVDLHGPHDHQSLLSKEYQLRLVDAFAGNEISFGLIRTHLRIGNKPAKNLKNSRRKLPSVTSIFGGIK